MSLMIDAVFVDGAFKPTGSVPLRDGTPVRLTVEPPDEGAATALSDYEVQGDPLEAVIGICDGGPDFSLAEQHDELLYGPANPRPDQP